MNKQLIFNEIFFMYIFVKRVQKDLFFLNKIGYQSKWYFFLLYLFGVEILNIYSQFEFLLVSCCLYVKESILLCELKQGIY